MKECVAKKMSPACQTFTHSMVPCRLLVPANTYNFLLEGNDQKTPVVVFCYVFPVMKA